MAVTSMWKIIFSQLFKGPATKMYPFKPAVFQERTRGKLNIDINLCIFCGICQKKCPTDAITVTKDAKEWKIDRLSCISCGACVEVCPKKCLALQNKYNDVATARVPESFHA